MLIIIRGLPGSGKTTLATSLYGGLDAHDPRVRHFENDHWITYIDDPAIQPTEEEFSAARNTCFLEVMQWLHNGHHHIAIVSNCFITKISLARYTRAARELRHRSIILTCRGNYGSTKHIPQEILDSMKANWQEL